MSESINNLSKPSIIVCDVDEVLVNISPKWMNLAFDKGLCPNKMTEQEVLDRSDYYLDGLITPDENNTFYKLYSESHDFYDDLPVTTFAKSLLNMNVVKPNAISKIHLITKCGDDLNLPVNQSKKRWLEEVFKDIPSFKIDYHYITDNQSKDYIFEHCDHIDLFVDDKPQNIADILLNKPEQSTIKSIAIPRLGYSALPAICQMYAKMHNTAIMYYNNVT